MYDVGAPYADGVYDPRDIRDDPAFDDRHNFMVLLDRCALCVFVRQYTNGSTGLLSQSPGKMRGIIAHAALHWRIRSCNE